MAHSDGVGIREGYGDADVGSVPGAFTHQLIYLTSNVLAGLMDEG